ncbi:helix-turn-helix transcriptional regulator [Rhodococcus triatomae]|uniref:DNA-binding transcriptional regulator, AcrR family n=1 Tax=Rhodococcus triatomae TaxID=300028 RepID=A0A1G8KZI3_9NOCA|nr:TetR/AcrR family transcriptional regulator [Rhodococcus triatomae]QNG20468.1 helix-turn-helix transcriptional regulator [Rhodococcus triatomae]QNG23614.1 helix-turn-helix transcriptional regulator [Rhodococcus triatomae]SDI48834.1 DNA-binding transcriptional regulator, AcrR family [Rhodococcus triatomae]
MRADAARRRDALISAARSVFAERGHTAPLDAIAEEAGVGIATLYRNFPTREDLAYAVAMATLEDMSTAADRALAKAAHDPAAAVRDFVDAAVEFRIGAIMPAVVNESFQELPDAVLQKRAGTKDTVTRLIRTAQQAGVMRADVEPLEFILGIALLTRPQVRVVEEMTAQMVSKLVDIFLDGLRCGATATSAASSATSGRDGR